MTDLAQLSARDAARRISAGTLSAEALTRACLERIAKREAGLGVWEHLDPDQALAEARKRDRSPPGGALHGIPIGIKDIMDTFDMPTRYGSLAYRGHRPAADAACVALARAAGAVVLGKTVTTEFAWRSPGKTRNPHNVDHTPGGSSSGSAAGVADFMMPLAFGTQTAGSILRPASFCGIVGYKPSFGMIAGAGTKLLAGSLDTIGGFARNVDDVAFFIAAVASRPELVPLAAADRPRIGLYRPPGSELAESATLAALAHAEKRLAAAGARLTERGSFPAFDGLLAAQEAIMNYEARQNLAFERTNRVELLSPATRAVLASAAGTAVADYDTAQRVAAAARSQAVAFFDDLDAVLVPAAPGEAPLGLDYTGDPVFNRMWTLLHLPCISLPAVTGPAGLPVGVQLVGRPREDARLLAVAAFAEAALAATA